MGYKVATQEHNKHFSDLGSLRKPCKHTADVSENTVTAPRASRRSGCFPSVHSHPCRAAGPLSAHTTDTRGPSVLPEMSCSLPVLGNILSLCPPDARPTPPPSSPAVTTNNVSRQSNCPRETKPSLLENHCALGIHRCKALL